MVLCLEDTGRHTPKEKKEQGKLNLWYKTSIPKGTYGSILTFIIISGYSMEKEEIQTILNYL